MSDKKILSREEFEVLRLKSAEAMAQDVTLRHASLDLLSKADHYHWIHQTTWMGEPILNLPQDMFALQEIIFKTKPKFIVEVGVAWGGSLLFYSSLMEVLGGEKIISVDVYLPVDLKQRISGYKKLVGRIEWVEGSSVDDKIFEKIKSIIGNSSEVLVVLDSDHCADHVLKELRLYSQLVGKGHYLVCGDTVVDYIPKQEHRPRPWGPGNSPKTALDQFLLENDRFTTDLLLENKLLLTCNPCGYLRCVKD